MFVNPLGEGLLLNGIAFVCGERKCRQSRTQHPDYDGCHVRQLDFPRPLLLVVSRAFTFLFVERELVLLETRVIGDDVHVHGEG